MVLGFDFIILSTIIIFTLLPLYIYRKKVFKFLYSTNSLLLFLNDIKIYLNETTPKIKFDFSKIDLNDKSLSLDFQKTFTIEEIIKQFINFNYKKETQINISKELIWSTYEIDSIPKKNSIPKDLTKRKDLTLKRDKQKCNRCGKNVKMDTSMLFLIKNVIDGGTYHFENLTILCNDCYKIQNSTNPEKLLNDLHLTHILKKRYLK